MSGQMFAVGLSLNRDGISAMSSEGLFHEWCPNSVYNEEERFYETLWHC